MPDLLMKILNAFSRPTTREFFQTGDAIPGYTWQDKIHGYFYGRFPYLYIGIGTGEHPLARMYQKFRRLLGFSQQELARENNGKTPVHSSSVSSGTFADGYHGKVLPIESARQLILVNEHINLPNLEQVIPYTRARDLILQNPDHIVALECPCRNGRENPCLPLDVCLIVGEPFTSFVADHHPDRSRWITAQDAVAILEAEEARGHVHHAFFKDAMLDRFYAICNCCNCCCGAMQAHRNGTPMLASSGYVSRVNEDLCIGCGSCQEVCQFNAITIGFHSQIDEAACMGCGVCVNHCPEEALTLTLAPGRGEPLEIHTLLTRAAVAASKE